MPAPAPVTTAGPIFSGLSFPVIAASVLTLATITGFAYLFSLWAGSGEISPQQTLRMASSEYVAGNIIVAGELAATVTLEEETEEETDEEADEETAEETEADQEWIALRSFLVGAGMFEHALQQEFPRDRSEELQKAIPLLLRAEQAGFPEGRAAAGYRMLGLAAQQIGDYAAATIHLQRAIDTDLTLRSELVPMLAIARARRSQENLPEAITGINQHLSTASLDGEQRTKANLLKIDWLVQLGRFDEATVVLADVGVSIAPALGQQSRWALDARDELALRAAQLTIAKTLSLINGANGERIIAGVPAQASAQVTAPQKATLRELLKELATLQREAAPAVASRARIAAAQAFLLAGENELALAELTLVRQQRPFAEEGLEGGLSEMELLAHQRLGQEVLQTARYLVREMKHSSQLNFTPKNDAEFRSRITQILAKLREEGQYEAAVQTAAAIAPLFGKAESLIEQGITYRDWGDATLAAGRGRDDEASREAFAAARARFRGAGDAFAAAAAEQFESPLYIPTLWSAIDAYQRGRHFSKSIPLLEKYLRYEERLKQPAGLVAHGRALLAEGRPDEAMDSLQVCIAEFPRDPMRYEARLLAAQAAADSHNVEKAKQLLTENLNDGQLTPQSPVWRDSLFTLGELLYALSDMQTLAAMALPHQEKVAALREVEPDLQAALRRLTESVDRYWPQPRAQGAAYLLARGYLLASRLPEAELENKALLDASQRDLRQKANRYWQSTLDWFTSMVRFLDTQERDDDLSEKQHAILRNALLGQADVLKSMGRFAEAADAYRDMSLRYMNEPPALEALLGQSDMVRRLGRDREADLLVRQAAVVLDRIGEQWDDSFDEITRFDREGWQKYLLWMNGRLDQARQSTPAKTR